MKKEVKKLRVSSQVKVNLLTAEAKPLTELVSKYAVCINDGAAKELLYKRNIKEVKKGIERHAARIEEVRTEEDGNKRIQHHLDFIKQEEAVLKDYETKYASYKRTNEEERAEFETLVSAIYIDYTRSTTVFYKAIDNFFSGYGIEATPTLKAYLLKAVSLKENTASGIKNSGGEVFKYRTQKEFARLFCKAIYTLYNDRGLIKSYHYVWDDFTKEFELLKKEAHTIEKQARIQADNTAEEATV